MERLALFAALATMALLPLLEILLRGVFGTGISGVASLTQHATLVAGMLGASVAAREDRLLSLGVVDAFLKGRPFALARGFATAAAIAVCAFLCAAGVHLVVAEYAGGRSIAYGIPVWVGQAVLPLGFALIAGRLIAGVGPGWWSRASAAALALGLCAWATTGGHPAPGVAAAGIALLVVAALLGAPLFSALGGIALLLFWADGLPIASVALDHYRLVVNPSLPMIPLFALVGYFLAESGAPRRLIRVFNALFGGLRGGAAVATVAACAFFTSFSGASGVTIIALGGMLMPLLLDAGYRRRDALGLLASAGSLGGLLPPGLPLVLYAIVARVPMRDMFLAGVLPCLLMVGLIALWGYSRAPRSASRLARHRIDWIEARAALVAAKWELALPGIAFLGLFAGVATPVEAAAITAAYAFVVEVFVHKDLDLRRDVPRVMAQCGLLVGGILLVLGVALGLSTYLVDAQVPERVADWVRAVLPARWMFLVALNLILLAAGCVLDIFSATVVLVPLLLPLGLSFGIDPLHLGIVFLVNMELGYLTPPVGMNLFFTAYRFDTPLREVFRATLPGIAVLGGGLALVTAVPWLSTCLPHLFGGLP